jgi:hypothetical protein
MALPTTAGEKGPRRRQLAWLCLRIALSAPLAGAAIFLVFFWIRSHTTFDRISVPLRGVNTLIAISYRGSVTIVDAKLMIPTIWHDSGRSHPVGTRTPDMIWPRERILGFGWAHNELMPNMPNSPAPPGDPDGVTGRSWHHYGSGVMLPDWFILTILLGLMVLPWCHPRFSLRTLLVATALIALLLGIFRMASYTPAVDWVNGTLVTE